MKKRHLIIYHFFRPLVIIFLWLRFGYTYKKVKNLPDNYIVLCNHTTDYDPVLVGSAFRRQMFYVASEHLVRWKNVYRFLNFGFEPIINLKILSPDTCKVNVYIWFIYIKKSIPKVVTLMKCFLVK